MSKEIQLTQGKVAIVDDDDFERLSTRKWYAAKNHGTFYAQSGKCVMMHRIIMNAPQEREVDHIDRNGLNNQKNNLRLCTAAENRKNRSSTSRFGYKGVWFNGCSFTARCGYKYLGSFDTAEQAASAYDEIARKNYGEFAYQNFRESNNG